MEITFILGLKEEKYRREDAANALSEMEAYQWNLAHLDTFNYPGAYQEFFNARYNYARFFYNEFQG